MRSSAQLAGVLLAGSVALACHETTAAPLGELVVLGTPLTVAPARAPSGQPLWGQFTVDVTLRNASSSPIRVDGCGPAAERELRDGDWQRIAEPICSVSDDIELAPMSERQVRATVSGSPSTVPELARRSVAGRYRLVYGFWTVGVWGDTQVARSAAFDVVE